MKMINTGGQIMQNNYTNYYLITGTEYYLIKKATKKIVDDSKIEFPEMNIFTIQQRSLEREIIAELESYPMIGNKRIVFLDLQILFEADSNLNIIEKYLYKMSESTVLIVIDKISAKEKKQKDNNGTVETGETDQSGNPNGGDTAAVKNESSYNKYKKKTEIFFLKNGKIIDCSMPQKSEMINIIIAIAKEKTREMSYSVSSVFYDYVENDFETVINELNKLFIICDKTITEKDIKKYVTKSLEYNIFRLHDLFLQNNLRPGYDLLREIINKESPYGLLSILVQSFELMMIARACLDAGYKEAQIATTIIKSAKIKEFRAKKAVEQCRYMNAEQIRNAIQKLASVDFEAKQGIIDLNDSLFAILCNIYIKN